MNAIIFDFNGTMFQDTKIQEQAWNDFFQKYFNFTLTEEDFLYHIHGRTNAYILSKYCGSNTTPEQFSAFAAKKEQLYRALCRDMAKQLQLTSGLPDLLNYLKESGIPMAIATASGLENVTYYTQIFNLHTWFSPDHIIYNDGTFPGKPAPDIYLKAAASINTPVSDCIVVEDAVSGIESAWSAGAGGIIGLAEAGSGASMNAVKDKVNYIITDFTMPQIVCLYELLKIKN